MDVATVECRGTEFYLNEFEYKQFQKFMENLELKATEKLMLDGDEKQEWIEENELSYLTEMCESEPDEDTKKTGIIWVERLRKQRG